MTLNLESTELEEDRITGYSEPSISICKSRFLEEAYGEPRTQLSKVIEREEEEEERRFFIK